MAKSKLLIENWWRVNHLLCRTKIGCYYRSAAQNCSNRALNCCAIDKKLLRLAAIWALLELMMSHLVAKSAELLRHSQKVRWSKRRWAMMLMMSDRNRNGRRSTNENRKSKSIAKIIAQLRFARAALIDRPLGSRLCSPDHSSHPISRGIPHNACGWSQEHQRCRGGERSPAHKSRMWVQICVQVNVALNKLAGKPDKFGEWEFELPNVNFA